MNPREPFFGAHANARDTLFRVWAPEHQRVEVVLDADPEALLPLRKNADGVFEGLVAGAGAGARYRYRLDGGAAFPDPASRFQPDGVHGSSAVVDGQSFAWSDGEWRGIALGDAVIYELHVGTFTPGGTFAAAAERLSDLHDLGVTAVEIMPVADFPGRRNWGYDGVDLFAPARCYGPPDDLRRLVDAAHGLGLAVILDVVYNHLGPDGNYLGTFSPYYFTERHQTPWGAAVNLDGPHSRMVRRFLIDNALHWLREYHIDGLRLDATHALIDDSPVHFLDELAQAVRDAASGGARRGQHHLLIAEDHRNLAEMIGPRSAGGWGLDAVWADDFHHQVRRGLAGDSEGYFQDFSGSAADLATTLRRGWFFCGQHSAHGGGPRGTDPARLSPEQLVICLQNHDQVGNRAFGERLHQQIEPAAFRAASALLLCAPETPLLFMGQEWAASAPFLYFTDHNPELGKLVTEGRRREFRHFSAFSDLEVRERIPDPQAEETFRRSRLDWAEAESEPHAGVRRLYTELLRLRRGHPLLAADGWSGFSADAVGNDALVLRRRERSGAELAVVVQLRGRGAVRLAGERWSALLTTEEERFVSDAAPIQLETEGTETVVRFERPGAVIAETMGTGSFSAQEGDGS